MHRVTIDPLTGCWNCNLTINRSGYYQMQIKQVKGKKVRKQMHIVSYELFVGPVPDGLEVDHKCRNRKCANPDHLEPVTNLENQLRSPITFAGINSRKTHCEKGHPLGPYRPHTRRVCKPCKADYQRYMRSIGRHSGNNYAGYRRRRTAGDGA